MGQQVHTQKQSVELVTSKKEQEEVAVKVFCLDLDHEGNEESESKEHSGQEVDGNQDYFND